METESSPGSEADSLQDWDHRFRDNAKHLELAPDCAESWVEPARLIMLDDHPEEHLNLDLQEAENCILKALALDSKHLEALEEAAHFYDVMIPDPTRARQYVREYIEVAGKTIRDMQAIVEESD